MTKRTPATDVTSTDTTSPNFGIKEIDAYIAARLIEEGQDVETDPVTLREVLNGPFKTQWLKAIEEELQSLLENDTWDVGSSDEMKNTPILGSRWVFKTKLNPDGSTRFNARLVIKGYQQVQGVDFSESFPPVSKLSTLRMLLTFASQHNWRIDHRDVVTAFLNQNIDMDEVYMELLEGNQVVHLKKALYGLRQAPRLWYKNINRFFLTIGFHQRIADSNLYIQDEVLLLLYVDDMLVAYDPTTANNTAKKIKNSLLGKYEMSDLGEVQRFLGLEVEKDENGSYHLGQEIYIGDIFKRFQLEDAHSVHSPMDSNVDLDMEPGTECNQRR
jgi:hypothetical protein